MLPYLLVIKSKYSSIELRLASKLDALLKLQEIKDSGIEILSYNVQDLSVNLQANLH